MSRVIVHPLLLLTLLFFFLPPPAFSKQISSSPFQIWIDKAVTNKLWEQPYWQRLLHYDPHTLFSGGSSDAVSENFFLSKSRLPKAELIAGIQAMFFPLLSKEAALTHFQCRFIARFHWLKEKLEIPDTVLPSVACSQFDDWASLESIESIEILFSGAQMGNPATMFGHGLLRIRRSYIHGFQSLHLLDDTVSFAAHVDDPDNIIVNGITGGFDGSYQVKEFHHYRNMYGDLESRDLWAYDLRISHDGIRRLMWHLWELAYDVRFNYYFFTKNCTYRLAELLEIAYPEKTFVPRHILKYPSLRLIRDINKAQIDGKPLVTKISYIPSIAVTLQSRLNKLTDHERNFLDRAAQDPNMLKSSFFQEFSAERQNFIFDTLLQLLRYRKQVLQRPNATKLWQETLAIRATMSVPARSTPQKIVVASPEKDPPPSRAKIFHSSLGENGIGYAFYYHDLLRGDSPNYLTNFQLIVFSVEAFQNENSYKIKQLTLLRFNHIPETAVGDPFNLLFSWNHLVVYRYQKECPPCEGWEINSGLTWGLGQFDWPTTRIYLRTNLYLRDYNREFGYNRGGMGAVGVLITPFPRLSAHVQYEHYWQLVPEQRQFDVAQLKLSYLLSRNISLSLWGKREKSDEVQTELIYHW